MLESKSRNGENEAVLQVSRRDREGAHSKGRERDNSGVLGM